MVPLRNGCDAAGVIASKQQVLFGNFPGAAMTELPGLDDLKHFG